MLIEHSGKRPVIDSTARIAPTAVICGDVTVGPGTSVGFGAVLTAESGPIIVGRECVIMENAIIRGTRRHPATIGDHVLIGPGAYL
jgi:carbonic anhydrase/acetyltransferase-like protein (isoleucine patch superfamily)